MASCRRKAYDQTGSLEDSEMLSGEQFENLYEYYRNIYKKVSEDDIEQVEEEYRGSDEEKQDLLKFYKQFKGDMEKASRQGLDNFGHTVFRICSTLHSQLQASSQFSEAHLTINLEALLQRTSKSCS